ncbi:MAG: hypothetical protein RLN82_08790 [Pseudomonadales bacterium]
MQRRLFLKRITTMAGTAAIPVTAASLAIQNNSKVQESTESLKRRISEAEKNITQLQAIHKKTIKSGLIVAGMLVGLDISLLI